jgi:DNA ligase
MKKTWMCFAWLWLLFITLTARASVPDLLLLTKYHPGMDISGWYMSEKLDGVRAYWNGQQLLSRKGNLLAAPDWFTENLPPFELDGELWIARGLFEETLSITSRDQAHPGWQRITYNIFEVPNAHGGLGERLERLRIYLKNHSVEHLRIIPQTVVRDSGHLKTQLSEVDAAGGEGLVLRNPESAYETGRSPNALKVKRFDDMEGRVVGYRPGNGKYHGMTGALWVEIDGNKRFFIGSGLTDQERETPPVMGSVITFQHQGFTNNGIPRFASYLHVREAH